MQGRYEKDILGEKSSHRRKRGTLTNAQKQKNMRSTPFKIAKKELSQLIEASPVAMVMSTGSDERVEWINDKFIELFGYTIEDMPDVEHWWPLAYPDANYQDEIKVQWSEKVKKALQAGHQVEPMEATVRCKDGSLRHVEFRLSSIGQKHLITFIDLTERKQLEDALLEREHHSQSLLRLSRKLEQAQSYTNVLNAAHDEVRKIIGYQNLWVYLLSEDGKSFKALVADGQISNEAMSEAGTATLPIQGDKMLEEIAEAREIVVVEDAQTDPRTNKDLVAVLGNRTIVNVPIILSDRHLGSVGMGTFGDEGIRIPTASEQEYLMALASHIAVTFDRIHLLDQRRQSDQALRENEEKFRTLAENSPDNIARYDTNCETIYVNPTLEKTLSRTKPEMLGTFPGEAGFIAEAKEYQDKMREVLQTGKEAELDIVLPDTGEGKRYHNIRFVAERGADGAITGVQAIGRDITERKQMEEALYKSEAELRALINTMTDVIFVGNSEGRYLKIIDTNASRSFKPPQELLGRTLHEIFPKEKADFFLKHLRQALETKKSVDFEYELLVEGQVMWFFATISPMTDDQTLMVARDITDRKLAEEALRESERRLIAAQHMAHVGYWERDFEANLVSLSDEACRIFGISEQGITLSLDQWHPRWVALIHPEDQPRLIKLVGDVLAGKRSYDVEYRVIRPDGEIRYIYSQAEVRRDDAGNPRNMLGMMQDITKRKQAEEALSKSESELRTLINTMTDIIFVGNSEGRFLKIIDTNASQLYKPPQELLGKTLHEVFPKEKADFFLKHLRQALETRQSVDFEYDLLIGDQPMWFYATISPMTEDQTLMVARNITVQKQAEEALQKNNALLERIFSSTEFLIAYMDTEFNFIRVNRAYAEGDQKNPEYFVGKNHFTLYPNEENEKIFRNVLATGETCVVYAKPFVYKNHPEWGTTYWNWTLQPVKEADGSITGLVISLVDVTARERAIIARHESDERYRTLIEQASDGIFVADPQGNYIDVNLSGCAMLGYTREEILALNMKTLSSPESLRERPLQIDDLRAGRSITVERELITKSGTLLPVEISGKMLDNGNFLGIVRDITERKRHERERKAIINVSASLRQATTRSDILNIIMNQLEEVFTTDGVVLVLPDPQSDGFIDEMGRGVVGEKMKGLVVPPGKGVCNWVIANKKPYLNNHAENDTLFYRPDLLGDSSCLASVPLIAQEQAIGALWIARKLEITQDDLRLLSAIADIAASAIHRATLHEQIEQQVRHLLALHQIDIAITTNFNLGLTLDIILKHVKTELGVDAASILLLNPATSALHYTAGIGFVTRNIERSQIKLGEDFAGRAALEYHTASCPDLRLAPATFSRSSLLADEKFISHHATPLIIKGQVKGVLEVFHRTPLKTDPDWINYFETLATQTAIAIENDNLLESLQKSNRDLVLAYDATIEGWSRALDLRDRETEGHTQRVTEMALQLTEKMGMSDVEKANLRRGALLHDIGKMGVPDSILHKPGALSEDEWVIMRQHPTHAYKMLSPITYLKQALDIPYSHHERWDGSGYPRGLKGEDIPLAARVFAVVDVYDALTSDRPYRKAWSHEDACRYLQENAGKFFDPKVVEIFLKMKQS